MAAKVPSTGLGGYLDTQTTAKNTKHIASQRHRPRVSFVRFALAEGQSQRERERERVKLATESEKGQEITANDAEAVCLAQMLELSATSPTGGRGAASTVGGVTGDGSELSRIKALAGAALSASSRGHRRGTSEWMKRGSLVSLATREGGRFGRVVAACSSAIEGTGVALQRLDTTEFKIDDVGWLRCGS